MSCWLVPEPLPGRRIDREEMATEICDKQATFGDNRRKLYEVKGVKNPGLGVGRPMPKAGIPMAATRIKPVGRPGRSDRSDRRRRRGRRDDVFLGRIAADLCRL